MNYGIGNVKAYIDNSVASNFYYGLTPPSDTSKTWIRTSATPISERLTYLLPLTKNPSSLAQETLTNSLPVMRRPVVFHYKNYIYIIGGNVSSNSTDAIRRYNMETNELEILDITFPVKIARAQPIVIGDYAYIVGGYNLYSNGSNSTTHQTIYKMNLKTLEITLDYTNANITAEMYNMFKMDDGIIIWIKPLTKNVAYYDTTTQLLYTITSTADTSGVNSSAQNKYGCFTAYGYNYQFASINALSIGGNRPIGQTRKEYFYNNSSAITRYSQGVFCIENNLYSAGGIRGSSNINKIERLNMKDTQAGVAELTNELPDSADCVCANVNESMAVAVVSQYLVLLKDEFTLNENESILEIDKNGNVINCYIGNSSNKAELFRVYKYNALTEKWEGVNCQDYSE